MTEIKAFIEKEQPVVPAVFAQRGSLPFLPPVAPPPPSSVPFYFKIFSPNLSS